MIQKRTLINISGSYIDPNNIVWAQQVGQEIEIYVGGSPKTVKVGKEYWAKICAKYFNVDDAPGV